MKKQTAMALAAVFAMSVAGTALAAPANPFVDVPAKHWAYDSINQLAKAGVISGYGDGTYKGDKTLTRYEMATIVAKAMANEDKADAAAKKQIEALKAEFGTELNNLGVRVDNLEKNASKVKFNGEIRERFEYSKDGTGEKSTNKTRLRLSMTAPIDDNVTFKGRFHSESTWGNSDGKNNTVLDQAYITGTVGGITYNFGRQPILLGQKLIINNSQNNDGLVVSAGKDIRVTAGAFKNSTTGVAATVNANYKIANIDFKLNNNLHVTGSYLKDDKDNTLNYYKDTAAGFIYTGLDKFTLTGEFAQNSSEQAKAANSGDKAKAWASRIKYRGADYNKPNSFGIWASYRKADNGFDPAVTNWNDFSDGLDWESGVCEMNNVKGFDFGVEYALFRNGIFRVQYNALKDKTTDADKKGMFAELYYVF